jgi:ribonuclease HI
MWMRQFQRIQGAAVAKDGGASVLVTQGITDPETMEAIACREGLALASDLAIRRLRLASDNINVVRSIRGEGKGTYGHIVQEIVKEELPMEMLTC